MPDRLNWRRTSTLLSTIIITCPYLAGCSSSTPDKSNLPPVDDSARQTSSQAAPVTAPAPPKHQGMSNGQKVVLLAGAAALYYMYKKNQEAQKAGNATEPQYYLSKNGRVYYRDKEKRAHWVTPPAGGISVPQSEAADYEQLQGYDNRTTGKDLAGIGNE